jgi:hypothetical protein
MRMHTSMGQLLLMKVLSCQSTTVWCAALLCCVVLQGTLSTVTVAAYAPLAVGLRMAVLRRWIRPNQAALCTRNMAVDVSMTLTDRSGVHHHQLSITSHHIASHHITSPPSVRLAIDDHRVICCNGNTVSLVCCASFGSNLVRALVCMWTCVSGCYQAISTAVQGSTMINARAATQPYLDTSRWRHAITLGLARVRRRQVYADALRAVRRQPASTQRTVGAAPAQPWTRRQLVVVMVVVMVVGLLGRWDRWVQLVPTRARGCLCSRLCLGGRRCSA